MRKCAFSRRNRRTSSVTFSVSAGRSARTSACRIHRLNTDCGTPNSRPIWQALLPLLSSKRTASWRNSAVYVCLSYTPPAEKYGSVHTYPDEGLNMYVFKSLSEVQGLKKDGWTNTTWNDPTMYSEISRQPNFGRQTNRRNTLI